MDNRARFLMIWLQLAAPSELLTPFEVDLLTVFYRRVGISYGSASGATHMLRYMGMYCRNGYVFTTNLDAWSNPGFVEKSLKWVIFHFEFDGAHSTYILNKTKYLFWYLQAQSYIFLTTEVSSVASKMPLHSLLQILMRLKDFKIMAGEMPSQFNLVWRLLTFWPQRDCQP